MIVIRFIREVRIEGGDAKIGYYSFSLAIKGYFLGDSLGFILNGLGISSNTSTLIVFSFRGTFRKVSTYLSF